jgi:hypothetical protein
LLPCAQVALKESLMKNLLLSIILFLLLVSAVNAEVPQIDISSREEAFDGRSFGTVGAYEEIRGKIRFAIDPELEANGQIVDVDKAPQNAEGLVEFSSDLYILKPKDSARSNRAILFDVVNRGGRTVLGSLMQDDQDGFLMERGYTILAVGWQFDVATGRGLRLESPGVTDGGGTIYGKARYWFRTSSPTKVIPFSFAARGAVPYEVADPDSNEHILSKRLSILDKRMVIPRNNWSYSRIDNETKIADTTSIYLDEGFEPGLLYELVYRTRNPRVAGLGYAAVRDAVSHMKKDTELLGEMDRTIGIGISQCGRFLRGFLYHGFNQNEEGEKVFDGVMSQIAGSVRSGFNRRFVQPSIVEPSRFPFSVNEQLDPETGLRDGLLNRARASNTAPKMFISNTSNEYWTEWKAAAMVHTAINGKRDLAPPDNVRVYMLAGSQHGSGDFPPEDSDSSQYMSNPYNYSLVMRALLVAMDHWVQGGAAPPPGCHPRLSDETLVTYEDLTFPAIPGVRIPESVVGTYRFYDGDRFNQGIVDTLPPRLLKPFPVLLPQVDEDGNELAGIRLPELVVPLATYTGWNLRHPHIGAPGELARLEGSFFALPRTKAEREQTGDTRLSIEERYGSRAEYLGKISQAALDLIDDGFLLAEDVPRVLRYSSKLWDFLVE